MRDIDHLVKSAMAALLTLASAGVATTAISAENQAMEKCYGIVKTAMNDCETAHQSCAGSATKDRQHDAFIFLPKGTCTKIVGASLTILPDKESK